MGRTFLPRAEQEESISIFSMYFRSFRDCSSKAACYSVDAFLETMEFHVTFQYAACDTAEHVQICSFIMFHHVSSSFLTLRLYLGELALGCLGCLDVADAGRPIILPLPQTDPPAEMGGTCQELCSLCIGLPWIATGLPLDAKSCYVLLP